MQDALLAPLVAFVLFMLVVMPDGDDAEQQQSLYCEMTKTFKETNGEYGWPEYKENVKCQ